MQGPAARQENRTVRLTAVEEGWCFVAAMSIRYRFGTSHPVPSMPLEVTPATRRRRMARGIRPGPLARPAA